MASPFDVFNNGNAQTAANDQIYGINLGLQGLGTDIQAGNNALQTDYAAALAPFTQNFNTAQKGVTAYGNALGLNGAKGNAAATQAFWNSPQVSNQLKQANASTLAQMAATGKTGSGAEATALANNNQGIVGQGWNQYIQNLNPFMGMAQNSANGIGMVNMGLGNNINANENTLGNANYGAYTSMGNANANAALANNQASANQMGALMGGLGMLANFL